MNEKQNEIIEKVLKLLELAKDEHGHEGERDSASKMAAKLMEQYALDFVDLRTNKPKDVIFQRFDLELDSDYIGWLDCLANGIATAFDVTLINARKPTWHFMFCGTRSDIDIAVYFFKYLRRSVSILSSRSFSEKSDQVTFALGMTNEISKRMKDLYEKRNEIFSSDSRALMVVKTDGVDKFVKEQFPNLRKGSPIRANGSREADLAGREAGRKVNISRPIGNSGRNMEAIA